MEAIIFYGCGRYGPSDRSRLISLIILVKVATDFTSAITIRRDPSDPRWRPQHLPAEDGILAISCSIYVMQKLRKS